MTWGTFNNLFLEKYFLEVDDALRQEFYDVKQGDMTVIEYQIHFTVTLCTGDS